LTTRYRAPEKCSSPWVFCDFSNRILPAQGHFSLSRHGQPKITVNIGGQADDPKGLKCPLGAHARRMNPRDATITGVARLHRVIRRSTSYGPMLPKGVLEDDGADRGIVFVAAMANLERQFEFVKTEWVNKGVFFGAPDEKDPLVGPNDGGDPVHHSPTADPASPDRRARVRG